jgi:hypothetical protein
MEMFGTDLYLTERMMSLSVKEAQDQAETRRLKSQATGEQRGWLVSQACRVLAQLGTYLVVTGERLKGYQIPERRALEGQVSGSK